MNHRLGLLIVDEEPVQQRDEDLADVGHHHHLWLGQAALDVEEMQNFVIGDKADTNRGSLFLLVPGRGKTEFGVLR